jgi:hypothetical protein
MVAGNTGFTSDTSKTRERIEKLDAYFRATVLDGDGKFICQHEYACKKSFSDPHPLGHFYDGQLHHVGNDYDLFKNNRPLRVVVVGMSYGHGPARISIAKRSEYMGDMGRHYSARGSGEIPRRTPHMSGTTFALRAAFGLGFADTSRAAEFIQVGEEKVHIFDAFALLDFLLCSAISEDKKTKDLSTHAMSVNCAPHFRRALEILEPNLLIGQGQRTAEWMARAGFGHESTYQNPEKIVVNGSACQLLSFSHPSARFPLNWGINAKGKYLLEVVRPAIEKAVGDLIG